MSDMVREEITRRASHLKTSWQAPSMLRRQQALLAAWRQVCWARFPS